MDFDTRKDQLKQCFSSLETIFKDLLSNNPQIEGKLSKANELLCTIQNHVTDLILMNNKSKDTISCLEPNVLSKWKYLGEGTFGEVYECRMTGSKVAVKILKENAKRQFRESELLRYLSHDSIVGYRGMGYITYAELEHIKKSIKRNLPHTGNSGDDSGHSTQSESLENSEPDIPMFIVMEFVEKNLFQYVRSLETTERHGLSESHTWNIGQQITSAVNYLHSNNVVHRDLKPDNILIEFGPRKIIVKVADFGLAWYSGKISTTPTFFTNTSERMSDNNCPKQESSFFLNIRWGAPEFYDSDEEKIFTMQDYRRGDIYSLGLVLAYTLTGVKALSELSSSRLQDLDENPGREQINLPKSLEGPLRQAIEHCVKKSSRDRPDAESLLKECFEMENNPYYVDPSEVEFFSCGFMEKTDIYVADSCTDEKATLTGYYNTGERPSGYDHEDLICPIETQNAPYRGIDDNWDEDKREQYQDNFIKYLDMAKKKEIDNNPTVALKRLTFSRPGEEECQKVEFQFKESDYCHHRSMRDMWMSLSPTVKKAEVPFKGDVHTLYSNSFGLHVAVLTNEGPDKPQKFIFPRRSKRKGMASPGNYTCGAVESASKPDYCTDKATGEMYVNLVNTAARGLKEEIGLELIDKDLDAICLTTVYLKFDTHEWGLCGFVDLKDERISPEHRISADNLMSRFTSGPKDKFEHQTLTPVDFKLEPMVKFVFENHENFASSAKLVVVKVLQAFFGWEKVQQAFEYNV